MSDRTARPAELFEVDRTARPSGGLASAATVAENALPHNHRAEATVYQLDP